MRRAALMFCLSLLGPFCFAGASDSRDLQLEHRAELANEARYALVIGNGAYRSGPLKNPPNDARAIAAKLEKLGFKVTLQTDLDYRGMMTSVIDFGQSLKAGGVGLFYYAGHGIQSDGRNYLVPVDASISGEAYVKAQAIDLNLVLAGMEEAHNRLNIMVLDSCRNNPFERSFRSVASGLAMVDAPSGTLIAYATSPGKVAEDGSGAHSSYTSALLARMSTPGAKVEEMFKLVREDVRQATNGKQTPWENTSLTGDFYFLMAEQGATKGAPMSGAPTSDLDRLMSCNAELQDQEAALRRQANEEWQKMKPLTLNMNASTRKMLEAYLEKWGPGKVVARACDESLTLSLPEVSEVKALLAAGPAPTGGSASAPRAQEKDPSAIEWIKIPNRKVELSRTEVTVRQYRACAEAKACDSVLACNPGGGDSNWGFRGRDDHPMNCVSWEQAVAFAKWAGGRLPTRSEWEFAANGGQSFEYAGSRNCDEVAWTSRTARGGTRPVAEKMPNNYGLYDMSGNVAEWVADEAGSGRVLKGGSWRAGAWYAKVAYDAVSEPMDRFDHLGFRVARTVP